MAGHRIRHGVWFDPLFGYRPLREVDGERTFLGPWGTEAEADRIVEAAALATRAAVADVGGVTVQGDTPLGIWTPEPRP